MAWNRLYFVILHLLPFKRFWSILLKQKKYGTDAVENKCSLIMHGSGFPPLWVTATHLFGLLLVWNLRKIFKNTIILTCYVGMIYSETRSFGYF